jgi:N-acetylmuramoyl-L-alanine amidase/FG-GAP-like repeat
MASVLAIAPVVTGFPQLSSTAQPQPVKSQVHTVGFVTSSVAAMRTARDATRSVVPTPGELDPITSARAVAVTPIQDVAGAVTVVGVTWPKGATPTEQYQIRTLTGTSWSQWQPLGAVDGGPDATEAAGTATAGTDPYVVTGASKYEVRALTTDATVSTSATVQVVDPGTSSADSVVQAPGAAAAATVRPAISTRAAWGADETLRQGKPTAVYGQVRLGFVHHTADSNTVSANQYAADEVPAMIRGMYAYHVTTMGWDDIGYNFLVDRFGRTWEGRSGGVDRAVVGAQTVGYNSQSTGVAAIGNFEIAEVPQAVTESLKQVLAWKLSLAGIPAIGASGLLAPNLTPLQRVSGHGDAIATICPGPYLYDKLPEIRAGAAAIMAAPSMTDSRGVFSPGDFTGEGKSDLLAVTSTGELYLYRGNGLGAFTGSGTRIGTGWAGFARIFSPGDFTGDRKSDLLAVTSTGELYLYRGNGLGAFTGSGTRIGTGWAAFA